MKRIPFLLLTLLIGLSSLPQIATAGRMYDPEISRFMSIDPILNKKMPNELQKLAGGQVYSNSPYNYTFNNPINLVDPDGNFPITPWDFLDIGFAVASISDAVSNPSWSNIGWAAADVAALLPLVPSTRSFRMGADALSSIPNWRKSEQFIEGAVEGGQRQTRFLADGANGSTKGSSVVDVWDAATSTAYEVKNYAGSLSKGRTSGLVSNMNKQYAQRLKNLPDGSKQVFMIDMTDFNIPREMQNKIRETFMNGKDGGNVQIRFFTRE